MNESTAVLIAGATAKLKRGGADWERRRPRHHGKQIVAAPIMPRSDKYISFLTLVTLST
jgi:hypothetical protein